MACYSQTITRKMRSSSCRSTYRKSTLLVNLCDGRYLRFDHEGMPTIRTNGEGGYLFEKGTVPHVADLEAICAYKGGALAWNENSPLIRYVFGVGVYGSESGVGR